jgi:Tfp pilus assembly protein PilF
MSLREIGILIIGLVLLLPACSSGMRTPENSFAIEAARRGLWKEATFYWEKLVAKYPDVAKYHNNLAIAYENAGDYEKALAEYQTALKLEPGNSIIKKNYGNFREFYIRQKGKIKSEKKEEGEDK